MFLPPSKEIACLYFSVCCARIRYAGTPNKMHWITFVSQDKELNKLPHLFHVLLCISGIILSDSRHACLVLSCRQSQMLQHLPQNVTTDHVLWQMLQKYSGKESGEINEVSTVLLQTPGDRITK